MTEPTPTPATDPAPTPAADPAAAPATPPATDPAKPATVLGSDPAADPGKPAVPATWPEDWQQRLAGGDEKALKKLQRYASPTDVAKALLAAQAKISSGELKAALPADAKPEEIAAWRAENGIPEKPEGYLEKLPDGVVIGEQDKALVGLFVKDMHDRNASPEVVQAAIGSYYKVMEQVQAEQAEANAALQSATEDALRADWGANYRREVGAIHGLLDQAPEGVKDALLNARAADGTALANNAAVLRWLNSMAREINPAATVVPGAGANAGKGVADRMREIEAQMSNPKSDYWKSDAMQKEYRDLIVARDKLNARAA
jgi:hypothetical protein